VSKGAIERWNRTFREEVEDELPKEPLPLEEVRSRVWSWLSVEYNSRIHTTTGRIPREDWLRGSASGLLKPIPPSVDLDEVFLHRERRVVRRDGTVRFRGSFFEVRSSLVGAEVELRFDSFGADERPRIFVDGTFVCDAVPLDPLANAYRKRHKPQGTSLHSEPPKAGLDALKLFQDEQVRRGAPPRDHDAQDDDDDDDDDEQDHDHPTFKEAP